MNTDKVVVINKSIYPNVNKIRKKISTSSYVLNRGNTLTMRADIREVYTQNNLFLNSITMYLRIAKYDFHPQHGIVLFRNDDCMFGVIGKNYEGYISGFIHDKLIDIDDDIVIVKKLVRIAYMVNTYAKYISKKYPVIPYCYSNNKKMFLMFYEKLLYPFVKVREVENDLYIPRKNYIKDGYNYYVELRGTTISNMYQYEIEKILKYNNPYVRLRKYYDIIKRNM